MKTILKLTLGAAFVVGLGCGGEAEGATPVAGEAPTAAPEAPGEGAPVRTGSAVCAQAGSCCTAYIEAMVALNPTIGGSMNAETTCSGVRQASASGAAGDSACAAAITGWREALTAIPNTTVPEACQ